MPSHTGPYTKYSGNPNNGVYKHDRGHDFDRHGHRRHDRDFFAFGFAGPYYDDYAYDDTCWRLVPTQWGGWQQVWVCGDYPY